MWMHSVASAPLSIQGSAVHSGIRCFHREHASFFYSNLIQADVSILVSLNWPAAVKDPAVSRKQMSGGLSMAALEPNNRVYGVVLELSR